MKEQEKSKLKFNIILCSIGIVISIICLLLELFVLKTSGLFWIIILICNIVILIGNIYGSKKM